MTILYVPRLTLAALIVFVAATVAEAAAKPKKPVPMPRPRPLAVATHKPVIATPHHLAKGTAVASALPMLPREFMSAPAPKAAPQQMLALRSSETPVITSPASTSAADLGEVKRALEFVRKGKVSAATDIQKTLGDPAAVKVIEWAILRSPEAGNSFERYAAFVRANPGWPSVGMLRRRAEGALWDDRRDASVVRAYFAGAEPQSGKGKLALARALLSHGDRRNAAQYVQEAWRRDAFHADTERQALEMFGDLITRTDQKARMDRFLYSNDREIAVRAAARLGGADLLIAKARLAVEAKAANAGALLDAIPSEARRDPGYMFSRAQWLRRKGKIAEAARLLLDVPADASAQHDLDEWWIERRLMARELLDLGDYQSAYRIARDAVTPAKENYRVDQEFTAGWIALRYLNEPTKALSHFARIPQHTTHPIGLARASYWQGRALEAMGRSGQAHAHYEAAARYPVAYYGQLARSRLGMASLPVTRAPALSGSERAALRNLDIVRAAEILYAVNERDLVLVMAADLTETANEMGAMAVLGQLAASNRDARAMLYIGKAALARGLPLEAYAFPDIGMPKYAAVGPEIDRGLLYAIARQESAFNQKSISTAKALGLMQVTPPAARYIAKKFGVAFNQKKLLEDPVYNTQIGAAELGDLLQDYRGSYLMSFVGYNAGRGRVRDWVARYGDPRDPRVDVVDWVERIPFSETRNYVQRVMENMQVYRARFGGGKLTIEADLRGGAPGNMPTPFSDSQTPHVAQSDGDDIQFGRDQLP